MTSLRLLFLVALVSGASGVDTFWLWWHDCKPPTTLRGRIEALYFDNDINGDGFVETNEAAEDFINLDYDGKPCSQSRWEVAFHMRCRYGWSESFGEYYFRELDFNQDGVLNDLDYQSPIFTSANNFRIRAYQRLQTYCFDQNQLGADCDLLNTEAVPDYMFDFQG